MGVDIINYSGGLSAWRHGRPPWKWSRRPTALSRALALAEEAGILVVSAAGNDGPEEGSINRPGIFQDVLTAGAIDRSGSLAPGSSRGPVYLDPQLPRGSATRADPAFGDKPVDFRKPDVVAPGGDLRGRADRAFAVAHQTGVYPNGIISTRSARTAWLPPLGEHEPLRQYCRLSGTSQATAMVTGIASLALEYARSLGLEWGSDAARALRGILRTAAQPLAAGQVDDFGNGRLAWPNVRALIEDCANDGALAERVLSGPQIRLIE